MLTIGIILIIFMTIFDYYIHKTVFSPVFMFNSLFLLIISLSSMRLYNLREYSIKSIEVIVLGMIFFSLGVFLYLYCFPNVFLKNQNNVINYDDNLNVNWTFSKNSFDSCNHRKRILYYFFLEIPFRRRFILRIEKYDIGI